MPSSVRWTMAPSHIIIWILLLFFFNFLVQSTLVAAKQACLDELIGRIKDKGEEEPEG